MEAPRGAREPTGTNGPTPHQPPPTPAPTPQTVSAPPQGRARDRQPHTPKTGPARGDGQPDTPTPAGPTNTGQTTATRGGTKKPQPLYEPRPTHPPPRHTAGQQKGGGRHNLVVVTAPGKRPATFRTWKLSPAAPMVLHPRGCGRVGNRHNTPPGGGPRTQARPPHTHPHAKPANTRTRGHTPTREHAQRCAQQPPTTASYCARPPSGLRLFMFQQSSGR